MCKHRMLFVFAEILQKVLDMKIEQHHTFLDESKKSRGIWNTLVLGDMCVLLFKSYHCDSPWKSYHKKGKLLYAL